MRPDTVCHPLYSRARALRMLLGIVREKYPEHWNELVRAVLSRSHSHRGVLRAATDWLKARKLLDEPERMALVVMWEMLAAEPALADSGVFGSEEDRTLAACGQNLHLYLQELVSPQPVLLRAEYLVGVNIGPAYSIDLSKIRASILADFTQKLDEAIGKYKRACVRAGVIAAKFSRAEEQRLELLAHKLVGCLGLRRLAKLRRHADDRTIQRDVRRAAAACGLNLS